MLFLSVLLRPSLLRTFVTIVSVFVVNFETRAQTVDFNNARVYTIPADRRVYAVDGTPLVGTHFVAQLYYGRSADSLAPVTSAPTPFRNVPITDERLAGTWTGATRTLTGMAVNDVATLQVCAWDATGGLTIDEAKLLGRVWGESVTFTYRIPGVGPDFLWYMEEFRAFTLVPEPSMIG